MIDGIGENGRMVILLDKDQYILDKENLLSFMKETLKVNQMEQEKLFLIRDNTNTKDKYKIVKQMDKEY